MHLPSGSTVAPSRADAATSPPGKLRPAGLTLDTSIAAGGIVADGSLQHGQLNDVLYMRGKLMASPTSQMKPPKALADAAHAAGMARLEAQAAEQADALPAAPMRNETTVCCGCAAFVVIMSGLLGLGMYFAIENGAKSDRKNLGVGLCCFVGIVCSILFYMHKNGGWWM